MHTLRRIPLRERSTNAHLLVNPYAVQANESHYFINLRVPFRFPAPPSGLNSASLRYNELLLVKTHINKPFTSSAIAIPQDVFTCSSYDGLPVCHVTARCDWNSRGLPASRYETCSISAGPPSLEAPGSTTGDSVSELFAGFSFWSTPSPRHKGHEFRP